MDLLEHFYTHPPHNDHYILRKTTLPEYGDINLFGARGSGKTALILDFLQHEAGMIDTFPNVARLVVISRTPLNETRFTPVQLFPLDYEEFIAFEIRY